MNGFLAFDADVEKPRGKERKPAREETQELLSRKEAETAREETRELSSRKEAKTAREETRELASRKEVETAREETRELASRKEVETPREETQELASRKEAEPAQEETREQRHEDYDEFHDCVEYKDGLATRSIPCTMSGTVADVAVIAAEHEICHVEGEEIEILVDCGSTETCCGPQHFQNIPVTPSPARALKTASGDPLRHYGHKHVCFQDSGGSRVEIDFEVCNVTRPILSVGRLVDRDGEIVTELSHSFNCVLMVERYETEERKQV
eukprot:2609006-Amphidinium_carterae.2